MVVLYSRLTSLSTIFTFRMPNSPLNVPLSVSDPYLLTLADGKFLSEPHGQHGWSGEAPSVSSLELRLAKYKFPKSSTPSGLGALYREKSVRFFHLSTLYSDLSLQKCVYVGQAATDLSHVRMPVVQSRQDIPKTPMFVSEDQFIVPNRVSAQDWEDPNFESERQLGFIDAGEEYRSSIDQDPQTLNFEWLERGIQRLSVRSSNSDLGISSAGNMDECLQIMRVATLEKLNTDTPPLKLL